jgi:hypothetical protein
LSQASSLLIGAISFSTTQIPSLSLSLLIGANSFSTTPSTTTIPLLSMDEMEHCVRSINYV